MPHAAPAAATGSDAGCTGAPDTSVTSASPRCSPWYHTPDLSPWAQMSDDGALTQIIDDLIVANPKQFEELRGGKDKMLGFFVGQVMKATQGKANPQQVNEIIRAKL